MINLKKLHDYGFTIIRNALPEYQYYLDQLINSNYEVHKEILWELRLKMKTHFVKIFNDDNLACSFDTYRMGNSPKLGWHIDQNQSHPDYLSCIQGVLILKDSNVTHLLTKSHLHFKELSERISDKNENTWEFYKIPYNDKIWCLNLKIQTPELKAGDFLLFDSRLVHSVSDCNDRAVIYISMQPQKYISNCIKRKRKFGFLKGEQTTHWCDRYIHVTTNGPIRNIIPRKYKDLISDI